MIHLPNHIEKEFFKVMTGETPILDFEQWVYKNTDLENSLSTDNYLDLISFSYSKPGSKNELVALLYLFVDAGKYETYKLRRLIKEALRRDENLLQYLGQFYDMYCDGYSFLRRIGLGLGLSMPWNTEEELTPDEIKQVIDSITPAMEQELNKLLNWLDNVKLILTGKKDELNNNAYIDTRSIDERNDDDNFPVFFFRPRSKKHWYQFWKRD